MHFMDKLGNLKKPLEDKKLEDYEVISIIENGAFDMCFKVRDKSTKTPFIWRGLNYDIWSDDKSEDFMREINILQQLQHAHILKHYDFLLNAESKCIFVVMEYMENDNLEQLIERAVMENKRIAECFIWRVFQQICQALQIYGNKQAKNSKLKINLTTRNVLLNVEHNIIKLTDFGLNRLNENNINEDKSTICCLACLIYELCTLEKCPRDFSEATFNNNDIKLWHMYSKDLKDLVLVLLEDNKSHDNIEKLLKHPLVAQHFTANYDAKLCLVGLNETKTEDSTALTQNDSIIFSEHNSILVEYGGQRRQSVDNVFTPDLRAELFYSARRKVFSQYNSDGQLYESICHEENAAVAAAEKSPAKLTHHVFEKVLLERLHAIRVHERLLQQKEQTFKLKERELLDKERRLYNLQAELEMRKMQLDIKEQKLLEMEKNTPPAPPPPPPIPPRKYANKHDDTYCSIDQDSPRQQPRTIAKLNLAAFAAPKPFPTLRKVTFQSPKKFISYDIDEIKVVHARNKKITNNEDTGQSSDNSATTHKRKSILSIFGLSRSHKDVSATTRNLKPITNFHGPTVPAIMEPKVLAKCETSILNSMWTKEHKRAAFDMLAAMNSAGTTETSSTTTTTTTAAAHNRMRQSIRERSSSLQRHRLQRRSMVTTNSKKRENLLI